MSVGARGGTRPVYVVGRGAVTPAGLRLAAAWEALRQGMPRIAHEDPSLILEGLPTGREPLLPCGRLGADAEAELARLGDEKRWRTSDRAVLLGVLAAREARAEAWPAEAGAAAQRLAVVMGSSRGATATLEREHGRFLDKGKVAPSTSPQSTAGAFAAAVAQDLGGCGLSLSVSSACATGLNAIGTAFALLSAGVADRALAGGAEASLTPFTLAQLKAAQVAAKAPSRLYPCRPLHPSRSGMIPAEGAACLALTTEGRDAGAAPLARVLGFGSATEAATATGISEGGDALVEALRQALAHAGCSPRDVALIVGHGASTLKGDAAELEAYRRVFGGELPPLTFHKWLTGHMIGASAAFSAALATEHLRTGEVPELPYWDDEMPIPGTAARVRGDVVVVAGLGFGGNASALVLGRG
jgi:3-oxoacyl-(acyl-carrier-protein) synthase